MRSKKNVETKKLQDGESLEKEFVNYIEMAENAVDWTLFCSYQLKPPFSKGIYKILQLPSMQIAYTKMEGGVMYDFVSPEECITVAIMKDISHKACIDQMKLETGMIAVIDDKKIYNFICSEKVELIDISFNKNANPTLIKKLKKVVDKYYLDNDKRITTLMSEFIAQFPETDIPLDKNTSMEIEKEITEAMLKLIDAQEAQIPHFTKSEKVVIDIKQKLFKHIDNTMSVETLAKKYNISVKSLQNAFKSLFGLKPNVFMRALKLNLVHHELIQSNSSQTSVSEVARRWGFQHMGRFSKFYTELFGENPSVSLKTTDPFIDGMHTHCVERKEEMN